MTSQKDIFEYVSGRYPSDTKFVVLPMDMEYMRAGKVKQSWHEQHKELAKLSKTTGGIAIPFMAVDPRRPNVLAEVMKLNQSHEFHGIKLYPPMGYSPQDKRLYPVYDYAQEQNLPIISHCSKSGIVRQKGLSKDDGARLTDPENYKSIFKLYPDLKICLAHFGGEDEWDTLLQVGANFDAPVVRDNWARKIFKMIASGEYPNLYTDIAYTIFNFAQYIPILKVLMTDRQYGDKISDHVLFGSDYYMIEQEEFSEKQLSMMLRAELGDALFWKIAEDNPKKFL